MDIGLVVYGDLEATSGGFRYDRKLVSTLREQGDSVEVISLPWRSVKRGFVDGISPAIRRRVDRDVDVLIQDELCYPTLWRHTSRLSNPDTIVSLIHHVQSMDPTERYRHLYRPIERRYLSSIDGAVATSAFTHRKAVSVAPTLESCPTLIAQPSGRHDSPPLPTTAVESRAQESPFRLVFLGNLSPRKNLETLLEALEYARERGHWVSGEPWHLTVVGSHDHDPAYAASMVDRVDRRGLSDVVEFTGHVERRWLEAILERSHCCCIPARYEGFGMAYLEAMEYGVVPIATSVGGPWEFIEPGQTGFLVDPSDSVAIATHLETLATDRTELARLGTNALEAAQARADWTETMLEIRAFLRQLVESA